MKLLTVSACLALATTVLALPADELEKRATCTIFGFTYTCFSSTPTATGTTPTTTTGATPTTSSGATATATTAPSTGGRSTYSSGSTARDIENNSGCTELTVIFARGTTEGGNIGSIAGPPMFRQLLSDLGASSLTLQGVNYPADAAGNANCGAAGGPNMKSLADTILARCPNTKLVLSGYSQGACVVHNTVEQQGLSASKVAATVVFGDPFNGRSVGTVPANRQLSICATGDGICRTPSGGASGTGHLSYGQDAQTAASFIERTTGV
ncbi:hypothetical protein LTR70_008688 [Exophiala xenobiotica]|uniref:Cutinase n=1 Tax=Lithohypha guttulata TaxID=1690604 RepID=A0ABR0K549_9EURO|nr:hypothetical protein LTR24_007222 [Lithohypha guttulata]KAK5311591.1 hypothetical protein LTR70_008688 [Exophiala xenobiotica]